MQGHVDHPFYVLNDAAYTRMYHKLKHGSRFEWSYVGTCPHPGVCDCPKFMNVLKDDKIIRIIGGKQKPVYKASEYMATMQKPAEYTCEINIYLYQFTDRTGYADTLKELAASSTFPATVNIHFSDRVMSKTLPSLAEFYRLIDGMVVQMK